MTPPDASRQPFRSTAHGWLSSALLTALLLLSSCASQHRAYGPAAAHVASAAAPVAPTAAESTRHTDTLVLISVDALRADYLHLGITPNLTQLAREGVQADWMTPSYPSLTFPNHYTLVTGLRPDHHGVVHNTMADPVLGSFKASDQAAVTNGAWWAGGEPIWTAAERAGLGSAVMFWPGSEADHDGLRPRQYHRFDYTFTADARVDQLLQWLDMPEATRPRLLLGYFDKVDSQGHAFGAESPEAMDALRDTDAAIGRLVDGIAARGLASHVNLVVVSDHGMADVPAGNVIAVEDMVTVEQAAVVSVGQSIGVARPIPARPRPSNSDCWGDTRTTPAGARTDFRRAGTTAAMRACRPSSARWTRAGMHCRARRSPGACRA